jgi:hypothetical protein
LLPEEPIGQQRGVDATQAIECQRLQAALHGRAHAERADERGRHHAACRRERRHLRPPGPHEGCGQSWQ